jgi:hypothetical protein
MPPYLPVVALNRSSKIRIDNQLVASFAQIYSSITQYPPNDQTGPTYVDLGAEVEGGDPVWKEVAYHSSIGQLLVVGPLTSTNAPVVVSSGLVATADGSDLVITVSSGVLKTRSTGVTTVSVGGSTTLAAASSSHPRIDTIAVNETTGAITNVEGTPAVSPVAPAALTGTLAIDHVLVGTSVTDVTQANVTDVAPRG